MNVVSATTLGAWSIWIYRLCRKKNTLCQSDRFACSYSRRPSTVFREWRRKTVEVCVEPKFQNGSQNKRSSHMHRQMLSYYSKPKSGSYYKDPRGSLPLCRNDIESVEKHYVCKNSYFNRKYSTEHGNAGRYRYFCRVSPQPISRLW